MDFLLYTLWFIVIAIVVNIVMEKYWAHAANRFPGEHERNERGEMAFLGRHRA